MNFLRKKRGNLEKFEKSVADGWTEAIYGVGLSRPLYDRLNSL